MANPRLERIERLLDELKYEVELGMIKREIDETIDFQFFVPISSTLRGGVVRCEFRTRPASSYEAAVSGDLKPKLRLVDG